MKYIVILDVSTNEIVTPPQRDPLLRSDQEGLSRIHPRQTEPEGWPQKGKTMRGGEEESAKICSAGCFHATWIFGMTSLEGHYRARLKSGPQVW